MSAAPSGGNGAGAAPATRPLVLLCECAGTIKNIAFDVLEQRAGESADVLRGSHWCDRQGQARLRELMEAGDGRQLVFAGCSQDFAARRLHKLMARGLHVEIADIREGCSWVHGDDVAAVTDKAACIVASSIAYPDATADTMSRAERRNAVVVIGGGVAGTQAAAELAQMGHPVELVSGGPSWAAAPPASAPCSPPTTAASACQLPTPRPAPVSASIATSPSTIPTCASGASPRWPRSAVTPAISR